MTEIQTGEDSRIFIKKQYYLQNASRASLKAPVVKILNCPASRVYRLIGTKTIRSKKVGPRVLVFKKEFDDWYKAGGK